MKIKFFPSSEYTYKNINCPTTAKSLIPNWYKKIKQGEDLNIKSCIPFLDAMSHGYIQTTWEDIHVQSNDQGVFVTNLGPVPIVDRRDIASIPVDETFHNVEFIWQRQWSVQFPKGYSGLIVHPLNRVDLPFYTISGIVDFDQYYHAKIGSLPFYIKKNFNGIIPKGTPMFQIIPIKRENWESEKQEYDEAKTEERELLRMSFYPSAYKKTFWQKKSFD